MKRTFQRRTARAAAVAAALLAAPAAAPGKDGRGRFAVKSVGTAGCARYLEAREAGGEEYLLFGGYLGGYVSAFNELVPDTFDLLPWQTIDTLAAMMANFCAKNPQANFAAGLSAVAGLIRDARLAAESQAVEARVGDERVTLYRETLRRAQARLGELGHGAGPPDGRFGPATRSALEAFQSARGLPVTGLPDQRTLFELFLVPGGKR